MLKLLPSEAEEPEMQVDLPDDCDLQRRAVSAGFASVADYLMMLVDRDAERAAIQEGIEAMRSGDVQPLEDFDREFRARHNLLPRA